MSIWGKISNLGIYSSMDSSEIRSLQLTNRLIFISGFLASSYIPILLWLNAYWMSLQLVGLSVTAFIFLFLTKKIKLNIAPPVIALVAIYHMTSVSIVIPSSQLELYLILIALIQLAAIKKNSVSFIIFGISLICFFISIVLQSFIEPIVLMNDAQKITMLTLNISGVFAGGFYLVFQVKIANSKYKNDILKERQEIVNKNKKIERQVEIIEDAHKEITDSINYSKRIQTAILPSIHKFNQLLPSSFVLYKPKDIVAGDFYWLEKKNNKTFFAVADCTGHGVPGAMMSVICTNALNRALNEFNANEPSLILDKTKELVLESLKTNLNSVKDGMDIALCSLEDNILSYSGANIKLYLIREGNLMEFKADKQPIGQYIIEHSPYTNHKIELKKGDQIYLVTDGFVDQFGGEKLKKFKSTRLKKELIEGALLPIESQKEFFDITFESWKGNLEQLDDVCFMGVNFNM